MSEELVCFDCTAFLVKRHILEIAQLGVWFRETILVIANLRCLISRGKGTAESKMKAFQDAGVGVAKFPREIAQLIRGARV